MKRKVAVVVVVMAVLGLIGSSVMVYAHPHGLSMPRSLDSIPGINLPRIELPVINVPMASMSAYEGFGLSYNSEKGGYCYNGKLVGLFVDLQGRGITYLNRDGEINIKAIRNNNGTLIGLAELSAAEYSEIVSETDSLTAEMDALRERLMAQLSEMRLTPPF